MGLLIGTSYKAKMETPAQQIEIFRHYAEEELKNHTLELQMYYQNRQPISEDLKQVVLEKYMGIYNKKLLNKISELITENNQFLKSALNGLKEKFAGKLKASYSLLSI
jgi:adenylyl- and sulfurtransferase ThiI